MKMTSMKAHGDCETGQVSPKGTDLRTMASDNKWSQLSITVVFPSVISECRPSSL